MNCERYESWMMDALDDLLTASDRRQLETHLAACTRCRAEWRALNALERMLANPVMVPPPPGFAQRVEARLDRFAAQRRTLAGGLILIGAAMALCLLAVPSLLNGRNPLEAYGAFLKSAYEVFRYGLLISYRLVSALWLALDTMAQNMDIPLINLLTYAASVILVVIAWRRSLDTQRETVSRLRERY